jgi:hypothetical protein
MSIAVEFERFILTASLLGKRILSAIDDNHKMFSSGGRA